MSRAALRGRITSRLICWKVIEASASVKKLVTMDALLRREPIMIVALRILKSETGCVEQHVVVRETHQLTQRCTSSSIPDPVPHIARCCSSCLLLTTRHAVAITLAAQPTKNRALAASPDIGTSQHTILCQLHGFVPSTTIVGLFFSLKAFNPRT